MERLVVGRNKIYLLFAGLALLYLGISLATPTDVATLRHYDITADKARFLKLAILLPYIAIWFAAFFGYSELRKYSDLIKDSRDGRPLSTMADGLMIFALIMPVTAITTATTNYFGASTPRILLVGTILSNYLDLVMACFAMSRVYKGAKGLCGMVPRPTSYGYEPVFRSLFLLLVSFYSYLMLSNPARQFPTAEVKKAAYYLPDFLLVTTIILPYVVIWYFGFQAANYIYTYSKNVPGKLYRKSLLYLAYGVLFIILGRISLRFFSSLSTLFATHSLNLILSVIYAMLVIIAAGYTILAVGARKLKRIEEV